MLTIMFPGQGSQFKGMGAELFARYPRQVKEASEVAGYDLAELCNEGGNRLTQTEFAQVALFVVNALSHLEAKDKGIKADFLLGHSLGEFNALFAAGVFDFATGVAVVKKRAELMASVRDDGTMAAILNVGRSAVQQLIEQYSGVYIANENSPEQTVISGNNTAMRGIEQAILQQGTGKYVPLAVSGPFHTPLMAEISTAFEEYLGQFHFNPPSIPVIANATSQLYRATSITENLVRQLTEPVHWQSCIEFVYRQGPMLFIELGAKTVLSKFMGSLFDAYSSLSDDI
ncbi:ACP S-malonyltransferase [Xenorhabdus sp. PB62.4]|uniref:ACP S-malonyltransferase n=1 Tax=Xenorhabdus sp. PB62.4 TaxID=1851573 RepID=UPI0016574665|nr:ACP S-malonyltransferase [Xenorhabdus sp. PB62.4]MBC8954645.1 putative malonyl-CoA transacylase [Xenorhabdus sp. PB62.4]